VGQAPWLRSVHFAGFGWKPRYGPAGRCYARYRRRFCNRCNSRNAGPRGTAAISNRSILLQRSGTMIRWPRLSPSQACRATRSAGARGSLRYRSVLPLPERSKKGGVNSHCRPNVAGQLPGMRGSPNARAHGRRSRRYAAAGKQKMANERMASRASSSGTVIRSISSRVLRSSGRAGGPS
jgi:hypothetical protein